jgi:hypothetical protein
MTLAKRRRAFVRLLLAVLLLALPKDLVSAQGVDGYVSLMADLFPNVRFDLDESGTVSELRARVFLERRFDIGDRIRLTAAGFVDGLLAHRQGEPASDAILRPRELHIEASWANADLRIGLSRVVWGRLDEFLPTDVVNPLDLSRFFLEGRSEGRIPVAMIRARALPSDRFTLEALYVPFFTRGRFDELDEETSPFNIAPRSTCALGGGPPCIDLPIHSDAPPTASGQGGVRANVTTARVDWSVTAYRGFETFPVYEAVIPPSPELLPVVHERFPRFTMFGGDFETVSGEWGVRGEAAAFVDRTLQAMEGPVLANGRAFEAGIGVDRRTGAYRVSASVVATRRWVTDNSSAVSPQIDRADVTLVAVVDRSFSRETRTLRVFAVYNPNEASVFARVISAWSLRDNLAFEASGGWFTGDGVDVLSRFATRDFLYGRLKVFF